MTAIFYRIFSKRSLVLMLFAANYHFSIIATDGIKNILASQRHQNMSRNTFRLQLPQFEGVFSYSLITSQSYFAYFSRPCHLDLVSVGGYDNGVSSRKLFFEGKTPRSFRVLARLLKAAKP